MTCAAYRYVCVHTQCMRACMQALLICEYICLIKINEHLRACALAWLLYRRPEPYTDQYKQGNVQKNGNQTKPNQQATGGIATCNAHK